MTVDFLLSSMKEWTLGRQQHGVTGMSPKIAQTWPCTRKEASCTTIKENMKKIQNMNKKDRLNDSKENDSPPGPFSKPAVSLQTHGQDWAMPPCVDWLFGTAELPAETQRWLNCPWPALSCVQKPKNWWHWKTWGFQPLNLGFPTFLGPLSTLW